MDLLSRLPAELLLMVLKCCPSLQCVYNLLHASPAAARLFRQEGALVAEALIKASLPPVLRPLARSVAVLRTSAPDRLPFGADAYEQQFVIGRVGDRVLADLLDATPDPRSVLAWAHRIARLERAVLARLLRNAHAASYYSLRDPSFHYAAAIPHLQFPAGVPYQPGPLAARQLSRAERFRVRRALWRVATVLAMPPSRIQMKQITWATTTTSSPAFFAPGDHHHPDAQAVVPQEPAVVPDAAASSPDSREDECQRLILPCVWRAMQPFERQELACVYGCLRDILGRSPLGGRGVAGGAAVGGGAGVRAAAGEEPPFDDDDDYQWAEMDSLDENADNDDDSGGGGGGHAVGWDLLTDTRDNVYEMNPGLVLYSDFTQNRFVPSPMAGLATADFKLFRRLGLGIWDSQRLIGLGLASSGTADAAGSPGGATADGRLTRDQLMFTWRAVLLAELEVDDAVNGGVFRTYGYETQMRWWRGYLDGRPPREGFEG